MQIRKTLESLEICRYTIKNLLSSNDESVLGLATCSVWFLLIFFEYYADSSDCDCVFKIGYPTCKFSFA